MIRSAIVMVVILAGPARAADHAEHHHAAPATAPDPHAGHQMPPAHDAKQSAAPSDRAADRIFGADTMRAAREALQREHGGGLFSMVLVNRAEYASVRGRDGYRWDGEAWYGSDEHRAVFKTQGEGRFDEQLEHAEAQLLYSRAINPYFDLQAGVRHDVRPGPSRTYAALGFEGLAPYWFELSGAAFVSDTGDVLARLEASYDQRITQRLIVQPRAEWNFAAQDVPEHGIGSGVTDMELGLRLRYEIAREFAPYIGVSYGRKIGGTAGLARMAGEPVETTALVIGIRAWF